MGTALGHAHFFGLLPPPPNNAAEKCGYDIWNRDDRLLHITLHCANAISRDPALVPCVGSALIIGAGESGSSFVSRVLSLRPVVFIGLISYSLYLWHWPIIVLNDLGFTMDLSELAPHKWAFILSSPTGRKGLEILLSFVLATLSWKFVERPFRAYPRRIERRQLFGLSAAVMIVLLLSSGAVIYAQGFRARFPARAVQVASFLSPSGTPSVLGSATGAATVSASTNNISNSKSSSADSLSLALPLSANLATVQSQRRIRRKSLTIAAACDDRRQGDLPFAWR